MIAAVLEEGHFILGRQVEEFEDRFAQLCGVRRAVALNSGTDALIVALRALRIGQGDEVITAPNSFVTTAGAIRMVGAQPVFVDVGEDFNIDVRQIDGAITPRTRAILPVHLTGRPADMQPILAVAEAHHLQVIEDCAQAVSAEYHGRRVGSLGRIGCFSLHPLKTLSACGDGGVLTTDDMAVDQIARMMRNNGLRTREDCEFWSGNSRLDTIQAAILLVKLRHLDIWTERRRQNAAYYRLNLEGLKEVRCPSEAPDTREVYHTFIIQAERRDQLREFLDSRGVGTAVHYPIPIHRMTAAKGLEYGEGSFPVAERLASRILSLPVYPELCQADLDFVVESIWDFYQN